jgi:hypothetical protein
MCGQGAAACQGSPRPPPLTHNTHASHDRPDKRHKLSSGRMHTHVAGNHTHRQTDRQTDTWHARALYTGCRGAAPAVRGRSRTRFAVHSKLAPSPLVHCACKLSMSTSRSVMTCSSKRQRDVQEACPAVLHQPDHPSWHRPACPTQRNCRRLVH